MGFAVTFAFVSAVTGVARAEGSETCNPAYEDADALAQAGGDKLLEARDKLRVCARPVCKAWMVKECTKSLTEVEARIPTVVLVAKDEVGFDLVDVTVTAGDRTLSTRLDGRAVEVGPGEKTFVFVSADGRRATKKAIVREGEKAQRVTVTFDATKPRAAAVVPVAPARVTPAPVPTPPATAVVPPPAPPHTGPASSSVTAAPSDAPPKTGGSALRALGYVASGAGIVGLGLGTFFGVSAISNKSDASCNENDECDPTKLADARSSATMATVGFVAGGTLLAGGLVLLIIAPRRTSPTGRIEAAPSVSQNEAGFTLRGRW